MSKSSFTLLFEDPFWAGIYQRVEDGRLYVCKIIFGREPKDGEVYLFLMDNWHRLVFSPPVAAGKKETLAKNPKRRQRAISKSLSSKGTGTKAQNALKLARQQGKLERRKETRRKKGEDQQRQFLLHTQKKKEKHKGH